jgi:hypothetical protein
MSTKDLGKVKCSCEQFEKLAGASVPAYTASFLNREEDSGHPAKSIFRCRVCGQRWQRHTPHDDEDGKRDSLIKLSA